jgi:predicted SprT family Zn-dependent metalloprotease
MSTFATDSNLKEYEAQIDEYGITDFSAMHTKTYNDILRLLRIEWWPRVSKSSPNTRYFNTADIEMDPSKLTNSQFVRAAVFHTLGYYIFAQLTQHGPDEDRFSVLEQYYKSRFREEFDLVLQDGIEYDFDGDGTVIDSEKQSVHYNRLVR